MKANISILELCKVAYLRKLLSDALIDIKTNTVVSKPTSLTLSASQNAHIKTSLNSEKLKS